MAAGRRWPEPWAVAVGLGEKGNGDKAGEQEQHSEDGRAHRFSPGSSLELDRKSTPERPQSFKASDLVDERGALARAPCGRAAGRCGRSSPRRQHGSPQSGQTSAGTPWTTSVRSRWITEWLIVWGSCSPVHPGLWHLMACPPCRQREPMSPWPRFPCSWMRARAGQIAVGLRYTGRG